MPRHPFSERLSWLLQQSLSPRDRKLLDDVVEYGCQVTYVNGESGMPGWGYTAGLHESFGHPEIVVIGLKQEAAHWLLNECRRRIGEGATFIDRQRTGGLLEAVECEFRAASPDWVRELMGRAKWLYGNWDFPVLQCVYPDLQNRLPWEEGFERDWRPRQPLVFTGAEQGSVEENFLRWVKPDASGHLWNFPVPPCTAVFTTSLIAEGKEAVLYVSHDLDDGSWQFHGASDSHAHGPKLLCFHHLTDADPSLHELAGLAPGWCAWRDAPGQPWQREETPEGHTEEGEE